MPKIWKFLKYFEQILEQAYFGPKNEKKIVILAKIWPKNGQKQWKFENGVVKIYKGGRYIHPVFRWSWHRLNQFDSFYGLALDDAVADALFPHSWMMTPHFQVMFYKRLFER